MVKNTPKVPPQAGARADLSIGADPLNSKASYSGRSPCTPYAAELPPWRCANRWGERVASQLGSPAQISIFSFVPLKGFSVPDLGKHHLCIGGAQPVPRSRAIGAACSGLEGGGNRSTATARTGVPWFERKPKASGLESLWPPQPLQPAVLVLQLPHLPDLVRLQAYVLLLPAIERRFADPCLADQCGYRYSNLGPLQHPNDLLHRKPLLLHRSIPRPSQARFCPNTNTYRGSKYPGRITCSGGKCAARRTRIFRPGMNAERLANGGNWAYIGP